MKKINKITKYVINDIKNNKLYYITLLVILLMSVIRLDYYIFAPGGLTPLDDRIIIENSYKEEGSFNLTYVSSRNATLMNILVSYIIPNWDIVDVSEIRVENETNKDANRRGQIYLEETSYDAIIAAFKEAGKEYEIKSLDLVVTYIYNIAESNLKVGDIVKKINNVEVNDLESLHKEIDKNNIGDEIKITIVRDGKERECKAILKDNNGQGVIGILITPLKEVITNPKVEYVFKDSESGSSRGLMCALEIYNKITEYDLTKGRKISGTGVIYEDGSLGAIDGVKYKLPCAVKNKADIFIVPSDNYDEAKKIVDSKGYKIKLIKADNLKQVIEELKK